MARKKYHWFETINGVSVHVFCKEWQDVMDAMKEAAKNKDYELVRKIAEPYVHPKKGNPNDWIDGLMRKLIPLTAQETQERTKTIQELSKIIKSINVVGRIGGQ
jgi:recombinational DNA repair ATPase RecF